MDVKLLIGFGFIIFASLTTQLPHIMFRHIPKMTGRELAIQHPQLSWIQILYPIFSVLWFVIFGFVPIYFLLRSETMLSLPFQATFFILGGAIGSISILHGLFGLFTNVCPIPRKRNRLYIYDEDIQTMALLLMAAGVFVIIIALAMIYFYVIPDSTLFAEWVVDEII